MNMAISVGSSWGWKYLVLMVIVIWSNLGVGHSSSSSDVIYSLCNVKNYSDGSEYESNVKTVLQTLVEAAPTNDGFSTYSYGQVYGLFQCRGDVPATECSKCSEEAAKLIVNEECPNAIGARIQLEHCFLRYENYPFAYELNTDVVYSLINVNNVPSDIAVEFNQTLGNLMHRLSWEAYRNNIKRFASGSSLVARSCTSESSPVTIYGMQMCWRSLSAEECAECLSEGLAALFKCCSARVGAQVYLATCTLRYETYAFTYQLHN